MTIARIVPRGIEVDGSLRSPDMLAPAIIPVMAGKYTPKTVMKVWPLRKSGSKLAYVVAP